MACCGREGCNLDFSRRVPAVTCHQGHLANEIQGAASGTITLPRLRACLGERERGFPLILENWGTRSTTHCGSHTVFPPDLNLVAKQTVRSVPRRFYFYIRGFKGRSIGWGLYFHFFSRMLGHCRFSLGVLTGGHWVFQREGCVSFDLALQRDVYLVDIEDIASCREQKPTETSPGREFSGGIQEFWQSPPAGTTDGRLVHLLHSPLETSFLCQASHLPRPTDSFSLLRADASLSS